MEVNERQRETYTVFLGGGGRGGGLEMGKGIS